MRAETLQDVPISVSAVTSGDIEAIGAYKLQDISRIVPNFQMGEDPILDSIAIRGIDTGGNQGFDQAVGTFRDGVYAGKNYLSRLPFLDVQRVEVVRGPQGTLFGRSAIGGTLAIISADIFALDVMNMAPKKVDVTYKDFKSLAIGKLVVELHGFGPGDGVATTVVYLPQEQIAFSADMYEAGELTNAAYVDDMNYLGVKKALNAMSKWDLRYAINAHQTEPSVQVLRENNRFVNELYEKVFAVLTETLAEKGPEGAFGLLFKTPDIDMSDYKDWKNYDHLPAHVFRMLASIYHGG